MLRCLYIIVISLLLSAISLAHADDALTKRKDVQDFINMMVKKHQFKKDDLEKLFSQVTVRPKVLEHLNNPKEAAPWKTYQRMFVTERKMRNGVKFWEKYSKTLDKAEKLYGVPPQIIVATVGVETNYGANTGSYRVIDSLSSIGFSDSRRAPFFRKELEQFLLLTREQKLDPLKLTGSYAGAIGVPQFMPSSYRHYAIDFSRTGSADLTNNNVDVIGSVANYYKQNGWDKNQPVAAPAEITGTKYEKLLGSKNARKELPMTTLKKYGIQPKTDPGKYKKYKAKVIPLDSNGHKDYWLGFHNFDVIRSYNPNDLYAMAVYQLSDKIKEQKDKK